MIKNYEPINLKGNENRDMGQLYDRYYAWR